MKAIILHSNSRKLQSFLPPDSGLYCSSFGFLRQRLKGIFCCGFQATEKFAVIYTKGLRLSPSKRTMRGEKHNMLLLLTCVAALESNSVLLVSKCESPPPCKRLPVENDLKKTRRPHLIETWQCFLPRTACRLTGAAAGGQLRYTKMRLDQCNTWWEMMCRWFKSDIRLWSEPTDELEEAVWTVSAGLIDQVDVSSLGSSLALMGRENNIIYVVMKQRSSHWI